MKLALNLENIFQLKNIIIILNKNYYIIGKSNG